MSHLTERADSIVEHMCLRGRSGDPAYCEDLWEEIERVLCIPNQRERMDAIEDLTLMDLIKLAALRRAKSCVE
jgi:hypothetical protein